MIALDSFSESNGVLTFFHRLNQLLVRLVSLHEQAFVHRPRQSIAFGTARVLTRSKADLIAENALLRQQLNAGG